MLLAPIIVTVFLLASSVTAAPTNSSSPTVDTSVADDDPLEVSETGHSRRRRLWRRLLKQVTGIGLGGYGGLGSYGLGGGGLNFLSQIAQFQNHNNFAQYGPHKGPPVYFGVAGGGFGNHVSHYPAYHDGGGSHGGHYGPPAYYDQGVVSPASFGPWRSGSWGLFGNYGLGGPDGHPFETIWL